MERKKITLIGVGRISPNHIRAAHNNKEICELSAVCDLDMKNMDLYLQKADYQKDIEKYIDYRRMIEEIKPDIIVIATDSGSHAEIAKYSLEKGCHVLIEKPMAMSLEDADELNRIAKEKNLKIGVCHQNRFNKSIQAIRQGLDNNQFGKLSHIAGHVRWTRDKNYYDQASWRGKWLTDGGCLMNQCIHLIDLMYWILDDIEEVFAYTNNAFHSYMEAEDLGIALFKCKNGTYGLFEGTVNVYPKNLEETLYVFGQDGTAKASGKSVNILEEWNIKNMQDSEYIKQENSEVPPNVYGYGHTRLYRDFIESIENDRQPLVDGVAGRKAVELIFAIYKSQKTGKPVKLPLSDFDIKEMEGMF